MAGDFSITRRWESACTVRPSDEFNEVYFDPLHDASSELGAEKLDEIEREHDE